MRFTVKGKPRNCNRSPPSHSKPSKKVKQNKIKKNVESPASSQLDLDTADMSQFQSQSSIQGDFTIDRHTPSLGDQHFTQPQRLYADHSPSETFVKGRDHSDFEIRGAKSHNNLQSQLDMFKKIQHRIDN